MLRITRLTRRSVMTICRLFRIAVLPQPRTFSNGDKRGVCFSLFACEGNPGWSKTTAKTMNAFLLKTPASFQSFRSISFCLAEMAPNATFLNFFVISHLLGPRIRCENNKPCGAPQRAFFFGIWARPESYRRLAEAGCRIQGSTCGTSVWVLGRSLGWGLKAFEVGLSSWGSFCLGEREPCSPLTCPFEHQSKRRHEQPAPAYHLCSVHPSPRVISAPACHGVNIRERYCFPIPPLLELPVRGKLQRQRHGM